MDDFRPFSNTRNMPSQAWINDVFDAKAVARGGIVRSAIRDVDREVGREYFLNEVRKRGFHAVECGGQLIVICNPGTIKLIC
jgi:hypothetical protein